MDRPYKLMFPGNRKLRTRSFATSMSAQRAAIKFVAQTGTRAVVWYIDADNPHRDRICGQYDPLDKDGNPFFVVRLRLTPPD